MRELFSTIVTYHVNTITLVGINQLRSACNSIPSASFTVEVSSNLVNWVPTQNVTAGDVFSGGATIVMTQPQKLFRVRNL